MPGTRGTFQACAGRDASEPATPSNYCIAMRLALAGVECADWKSDTMIVAVLLSVATREWQTRSEQGLVERVTDAPSASELAGSTEGRDVWARCLGRIEESQRRRRGYGQRCWDGARRQRQYRGQVRVKAWRAGASQSERS